MRIILLFLFTTSILSSCASTVAPESDVHSTGTMKGESTATHGGSGNVIPVSQGISTKNIQE